MTSMHLAFITGMGKELDTYIV